MAIFAVIKPRNGHAILGFHEAVIDVLDNESRARLRQHCQVTHNMHNSKPAAEAQAQRDGTVVSPSAKIKVYKGYFVYDLQNLPSQTNCWYIGTGAPDLKIHQHLRAEHLEEVHAIVTFEQDSRQLHIAAPSHNDSVQLTVNSKLSVNGHMLEDGDVIKIGHMEFDLEYTSHYNTDEFHHEADVVKLGKPQRPGSSRAPTVVNHFSLDVVVAEGRSGSLIKAHKTTKSDSIVAIEKMLREDPEHPGRSQRKGAKSFVLSSFADRQVLGADRIVHRIDCFVDGEYQYLVYPFVDVTLAEVVMEGAQSDAVTKGYVSDMLQAADFLHTNGYMSGGLHPRNIGVRQGHAVLLTVHSVVICPQGQVLQRDANGTGPPGYTAPEREYTEYSSAADIWSIAVIAVELSTGSRPWPTETNIWQRQPDMIALRSEKFSKPYRQVIKHLKQSGSLFCLLLRAMLSHEWAPRNFAPRPTAYEALRHDGLKLEEVVIDDVEIPDDHED